MVHSVDAALALAAVMGAPNFVTSTQFTVPHLLLILIFNAVPRSIQFGSFLNVLWVLPVVSVDGVYEHIFVSECLPFQKARVCALFGAAVAPVRHDG